MLKKLIIVLFLLSLIVTGIWYAGIPDRWAAERIEGLLQGGRVRTELFGFKKTPFFGFKIEEVRIRHNRRQLLSIDGVSGRIDPLSLFLFGVRVSFTGHLSGGTISGEALLKRNGIRAAIDVRSVRLEGLDLMADSAIRGRGSLDMTVVMDRGEGDLYFEVKNMALKDIRKGGLYLPLKFFNDMKGAGSFRGERLRIDALSMEGDHIYGRLRNCVLERGYLKGTLDVVAESGFPEDSLVLLEPYKQAPGYYAIPLKGKLRDIL
ncbi:MAG TPA: type II secretion system protein GspN [Nitrospirae bacterium]|nr:type II secretion system protein GspN [Nitrospirota bacterium]